MLVKGFVFTKLNFVNGFEVQLPDGADALMVVVDVVPLNRPAVNLLTSLSCGDADPGALNEVSVVATDDVLWLLHVTVAVPLVTVPFFVDNNVLQLPLYVPGFDTTVPPLTPPPVQPLIVAVALVFAVTLFVLLRGGSPGVYELPLFAPDSGSYPLDGEMTRRSARRGARCRRTERGGARRSASGGARATPTGARRARRTTRARE